MSRQSGVPAEIDPAKFAAAAARVRDKDGFHVVPLEGVAAAMDEHDATRRTRTVAGAAQQSHVKELRYCVGCGLDKDPLAFKGRDSICIDCHQELAARRAAPASEGVTGDPAPSQAPVVTTASSPNAGLDAGEQPVAPSEVDETEERLEYLESRMAELDETYLNSMQARAQYFTLLLKIGDARWRFNHDFDPIAARIEKMITHMRYAEDGWPQSPGENA